VLLTIGQLAEHCGVTVRAIRHYHRIGLLPEPQRDGSGYRRYGAKAVVSLIRIKVLAEAGVPLVRVHQLLEATPADFATAVTGIDQALAMQIAQLEQRRRQLTGLLAGDRLVLPAQVAELLEELAAMGASERAVDLERDAWILMEALAPEFVADWARSKRSALSDPEFRDLYLACDAAWELDADDARLDELATRMAKWMSATSDTRKDLPAGSPESKIILVGQLIDAEPSNTSPAWRRLEELSKAKLATIARIRSLADGDADGRARAHPEVGTIAAQRKETP
jgi:DNA-binding transcriptional MerR regulator